MAKAIVYKKNVLHTSFFVFFSSTNIKKGKKKNNNSSNILLVLYNGSNKIPIYIFRKRSIFNMVLYTDPCSSHPDFNLTSGLFETID